MPRKRATWVLHILPQAGLGDGGSALVETNQSLVGGQKSASRWHDKRRTTDIGGIAMKMVSTKRSS